MSLLIFENKQDRDDRISEIFTTGKHMKAIIHDGHALVEGFEDAPHLEEPFRLSDVSIRHGVPSRAVIVTSTETV